jgi:hypothetical protein
MSLGDGLARALEKYQRAKERFGLRALLLGEVDLKELDRPVGEADKAFVSRGSGNGKHNGPGNGNGHGVGNGGAPAGAKTEVRHGPKAAEDSSPAPAESPLATATLTQPPNRLRGFKIKCEQCGSTLYFSEGCVKCPNPQCGYAAC